MLKSNQQDDSLPKNQNQHQENSNHHENIGKRVSDKENLWIREHLNFDR